VFTHFASLGAFLRPLQPGGEFPRSANSLPGISQLPLQAAQAIRDERPRLTPWPERSGLEGTSIAFLCAATQPPGTAQRNSGFPNLSPSFQREKLVPFLHIDPRLHFLTNVEKEALLDLTPANMFWSWKKSQNKSFRTNPWQDTVLKASSLSLLENTHLANMQEKSRVNLRLSSPACFFQKTKTEKRKHIAKTCHCCKPI
jgi:hypothetical protein